MPAFNYASSAAQLKYHCSSVCLTTISLSLFEGNLNEVWPTLPLVGHTLFGQQSSSLSSRNVRQSVSTTKVPLELRIPFGTPQYECTLCWQRCAVTALPRLSISMAEFLASPRSRLTSFVSTSQVQNCSTPSPMRADIYSKKVPLLD